MFEAESYEGSKLCWPGDLVINTMWAWMSALGVSNYHGIVSPSYGVYRLHDPQTYNPRFLDLLLRTPEYAAEYMRRSTGIRQSRLRLYPEEFLRIPLPVPPRPEQDAIVAYLDGKLEAIDRYLRVKEREIALLEERKRALIHRAVTRGLDPNPKLQPSGIPWLPEIPVGWEAWRIGHLARVGNGSTPARSQPSYWTEGAYPWLNSASVNQGTITESDQFVTPTALRECHLPIVPRHSVLVAITGQGKTRGTAALLDFEATINQHLAFITITNPRLVPRYLHLALRGLYAQLRAMSDDSGSTKGALTCHDLKHLKIPMPPKKLQLMIVGECNEEVEKIDTTITRARRQIKRMQEYRTALIAEAVTGKIDVTDRPT
ncbi:restriction endonuclease subunit S [Haloferula sp. A504]|uniref:restriction endonuclease subunit S n=1 Tax=Haloferula sp. A504 TaxID=3373601 RepID=UPI0031C02C9E|nr:restriction endonuclease subunit S [Verrucomicrobiaceae bacterium E54]